jgi:hypothetical protein
MVHPPDLVGDEVVLCPAISMGVPPIEEAPQFLTEGFVVLEMDLEQVIAEWSALEHGSARGALEIGGLFRERVDVPSIRGESIDDEDSVILRGIR